MTLPDAERPRVSGCPPSRPRLNDVSRLKRQVPGVWEARLASESPDRGIAGLAQAGQLA